MRFVWGRWCGATLICAECDHGHPYHHHHPASRSLVRCRCCRRRIRVPATGHPTARPARISA